MKIVIVTDNQNKSILDKANKYPKNKIIIVNSTENIETSANDHIIFLKKDKFDILGNKYLFLTEGNNVKENYFIMKSFRDVQTNIRKVLLLIDIIFD